MQVGSGEFLYSTRKGIDVRYVEGTLKEGMLRHHFRSLVYPTNAYRSQCKVELEGTG